MSDGRIALRVTEDQFRVLFDAFPDDPQLIERVCQEALSTLHVPYQTGRWPKYDARVYYDDGPMGSGYLLVHWEDARKVPGCMANGYMEGSGPNADEIQWDDNPERERLLSIQNTLSAWAWPTLVAERR